MSGYNCDASAIRPPKRLQNFKFCPAEKQYVRSRAASPAARSSDKFSVDMQGGEAQRISAAFLESKNLRLPFDCNSTALRQFDDLHYDSWPTSCGLLHCGQDKM